MTAELPPGAPPPPAGPLVVRLRNWVGDVLLGLPMLCRLAAAGYGLQLVGKGWARDLLAGHGWPVHVLPATFGERVRLLSHLRGQMRAGTALSGGSPRRRIDALCLPYSFSSALELRLAGLRALGHAHEGRSLLLARAVPRAHDRHELAVYWQLGDALLGGVAPLPQRIGLVLATAHRDAAAALRAHHGIGPGYVVICPFAGGTFDKRDKTWPAFAAFVREDLEPLARAQGRRVLVCPGPGEEALARHFPAALCLEGVRLGTYAALLADAALMISNDTGPGHLAAAVGTPLLSVLGPTDADRWGAWGPGVHSLGGRGTWPSRENVLAAAQARLAAPAPAPAKGR
ncbi:MAG: glycosyltransferase family 9 protein [Rubrivivax sp.]|nr:glycosyltransferase family 9 protein [Rubrivivax sp.]